MNTNNMSFLEVWLQWLSSECYIAGELKKVSKYLEDMGLEPDVVIWAFSEGWVARGLADQKEGVVDDRFNWKS